MKTWQLILLCIVFCILLPLAVSKHLNKAPTTQEGSEMNADALKVLEASNKGLHREVLDNGMICLVKQDTTAPVVSIQVWVRTGAIHEDDMLGSGLSHAIEHMIFKGTKDMSPGDVFRLISNAGGEMNAYTSFDRTVFHIDLPADSWTTGLSVISDAIKDPAFPEEEWQKEREVILREFAMGRDDPGRVLDKLVWRTAFAVHPYRFPIIGIEESFRKIARDDLMSFFKENYVADNMIAVVVGDVTNDQAMKELSKAFGAMASTPRKSITLPQEPGQLAPRSTREPGNWNLSRCELAYHTVALSDPDAVALDLVSDIISNGRSSRFVKSIQEEQQLVHKIAAYSFTPLEPGIFGIYAEFDPAKEEEVLAAIAKELETLLRDGCTDEELAKARKQAMVSSLSSLQNMKGQANSYASGEFYAADPFFTTTYLRNLASITKEDLLRVSRKYLVPENSTTALIVPASQKEDAAVQSETSAVAMPAMSVTPSGITLITREDHRLPFVSVCVALKGGFISETDSNCGITKFMSDLLLRGTPSLSSEEIANEIESRAGSIHAFSGINSFGLRARCLTADAPRFMELLADCLQHPAFTADEIEKQRKLHLATITQQRERPIALAQEELRKIMFPSHPYRFSPLGTEQSVSGISKAMLSEFHSKLLAKNRLVVSAFGDITPELAETMVEGVLQDLPDVADGLNNATPPQFSLPSRKVVETDREQTIILIGYPGFELNDPRNDALTLLDAAMSGLSSEVARKVREERGLAYFVGSYNQLALQGGAFVMYAGTREDARDEVESLMQEEAVRVTTSGLTEEEFARAKTTLITGADTALQNNSDMAMKSALDQLLGLGFDNAFKARERFNNLSIEVVREAASAALKPERMATSIIIPKQEVK
jgi:zinc protease